MTAQSTTNFVHQGFFHLRTPVLPAGLFMQWQAARDPAAFVLEQFESPALREALYLASPNLYERLTEHERGAGQAPARENTIELGGKSFGAPSLPKEAADSKLITALGRYLARAAFRGTPFGMFSTVSTGRIGPASDFSGLAAAPIVRHVHYDADIEQKVLAKLLQTPALRQRISYTGNSSLAELAGAYYFVETQQTPGRPKYLLSKVERNEALAVAIQAAGPGIQAGALAALVAARCEVDQADAAAYVEQLVDMQILVPTLALPVSGGQRLLGLHQALQRLDAGAPTQPLAALLQAIRAKAAAPAPASLVDDYRQAVPLLQALDVTPATRGCVFQVDCRRDFQPTLDAGLVADILASSRALIEFGMEPPNDMAAHKRLFQERFERQEVPLELALHSEFGVPYPAQAKGIAELLDGVQFGGGQRPPAPLQNPARSRVLTACFERALRAGVNEVHITDADIDAVRAARPPAAVMPEGVYAQATLFDGRAAEGAAFRLNLVSGRSGAEMLGRFTSIDETLLGHVRQLLRRQEQQDSERIYAEVVHSCGGRVNNILSRPPLRDYEIVFLGASEIPTERQIPISDLTLRLVDGQYRLRSRRLGKEVVPRLTTAHNFNRGTLGMYYFLCSLQLQDRPQFGNFVWPNAFDQVKRLPRVCYRNSVWCAAMWRFDQGDTQALRQAAAQGGMAAWRARHALPRFVTVDAGDNSLPIDLHNPLLVATLLEEVGNSPAWTLTESISLNLDDAEPGTQPRFSKEVVIPFLHEKPVAAPAGAAAPRARPVAAADLPLSRQGRFGPGSQWSYFKLYCGELQIDALIDSVAPLLKRAQQQQLIDTWFFVRYADPDKHLRVRFRSASPAQLQAVNAQLSQALAPALASMHCKKIMLDTYEQELERYGGPEAMELAEQMFCIDSALVADLLALRARSDEPPARWLVALLGIDAWLAAFGLAPAAALELMTRLGDGFKDEFAMRAAQKVQLGAKYRGYRAQLDACFFADSEPPAARAVLARIRQAHAAMHGVATRLRALETAGHLEVALGDIVSSILHMHCNRILEQEARQHEAVLYDFMARILASRQSRSKRPAPQALQPAEA